VIFAVATTARRAFGPTIPRRSPPCNNSVTVADA